MTGMGRPPLWFYTTTHGPRTKESQVSQPRGRGAGQWPAAGGATHSTHSTQRKRARARARWGSFQQTAGANATPRRRAACVLPVFGGRVALRVLGLLATVIAARSKQAERATKKRHAHDKNETRQRRGGDRECDERRSRAARSTHARRTSRLPEADPRARLACRERGGGVAARWWSGVERREATTGTPPPRERKHISRAQCMTCSTVAVTTTEVTSHKTTTCRRRCAPWLHAEPPTRKRSWHLAARSSPSSHPGDSHRRRPRQPARVLAPAP